MEGQYKIAVYFTGRHIPKSPYLVDIAAMAADPSKVTVEGPGVGGVVPVNKMTSFRVLTTSELSVCLSVSVCLCVWSGGHVVCGLVINDR